jgi:hypothetical protein
MNPIAWIARQLDAGWFSRILLMAQFWFVYWILDWSMAYASTALATKAELMGAAANIAAVAAVPQALLMMATNSYMQMRAQQFSAPADRRGKSVADKTTQTRTTETKVETAGSQ